MLTVKLHTSQDTLCLSMAGHAGAGVKGGDIVCAAASILAYTAAEEVLQLHRAGILHQPPLVRLMPGSARVEARNCLATRAAFSVIETGFSLLAAQYPENVNLER